MTLRIEAGFTALDSLVHKLIAPADTWQALKSVSSDFSDHVQRSKLKAEPTLPAYTKPLIRHPVIATSFMELQTESQATLVSPPDEYLELVLEKSSTVLNTRLLVDGKPRYRLSTMDRDAAHTKLTDLRTNEMIASFKRRTFFADKVQFARRFEGKSIKKDEWMVKIKLDSGQ